VPLLRQSLPPALALGPFRIWRSWLFWFGAGRFAVYWGLGGAGLTVAAVAAVILRCRTLIGRSGRPLFTRFGGADRHAIVR